MTNPDHNNEANQTQGPVRTYGAVKIDPTNVVAPFPIKRAYVIYGTGLNVTRGKHAHRNLRQLAHSVIGACTMTIDDKPYRLDSPEKGVTMGPMSWREMSDFTPDCVLVVYADQHYDPADYIWDRNNLSA
jgi:hypothetical protein